jgi:dienelactone hydrolase
VRRLFAALISFALIAPAAHADAPRPGTPEYSQRDNQNMQDAYGRQFRPGGQLSDPAYAQAEIQQHGEEWWSQLGQQLATPTRIAASPGNVFPGWNGENPFRRGWSGRRGQQVAVSYTNRYGALIRGTVFAPLAGATDPYSGRELTPPFPGVVITTGSIQASERMYWWLAQDLAERGYVVITYDVQGQGTSETAPHDGGPVNAMPFCNPFAPPRDGESFGCPGVPHQQQSNFSYGTEDATTFMLSTPAKTYPNPTADDPPANSPVNSFNPYWALLDHSPDKRTVTPGRMTRIAIVGHSLGAAAVSHVQGVDARVEAVVAFDKLSGSGGQIQSQKVTPAVPALAVQSDYGFNVQPYWMAGGSSFTPTPGDPSKAPDPRREQKTGFDAWRKAGVDTMLIVPRASTHLDYSDIAYALPASRYGQALTSVYVQAWLDRYLKHQGEPAAAAKGVRKKSRRAKRRAAKRRRAHKAVAAQADPLLAEKFTYLEPVAVGKWQPVTLERAKLLSLYFCSGWSFRDPVTRQPVVNLDPGGAGGCSQ